ncbi:5-formyltetrahydrofolate cyclo-ligase [Candidatus Micrarchaeota archaeon]|nr:5-formyltetrahydrofolate cyclo-ligase [Candidatus Micrarchaeota archaeon]
MVQHLKANLRKRMLAQRDSLSKEELTLVSNAIGEKLINHPRFKEAQCIGFYLPKGNEVDTTGMISRTFSLNKEVAVPVTTDHAMSFCRLHSLEKVRKGKFGICEPETLNPEPVEPPLVIVPGVAFGLCMHRLGYGRGYYDKYLAKSFAYRIGVCFDFQLVEKLPSHENDQRMDEIITEKRAILL